MEKNKRILAARQGKRSACRNSWPIDISSVISALAHLAYIKLNDRFKHLTEIYSNEYVVAI